LKIADSDPFSIMVMMVCPHRQTEKLNRGRDETNTEAPVFIKAPEQTKTNIKPFII